MPYKEILSDEDFTLYSKLREFRKNIAATEGIPAYAVFTNEQLAEISKRRPLTKTDLLKISGIGKAKNDKYGEKFTNFVNEALDETGGKPIPFAVMRSLFQSE